MTDRRPATIMLIEDDPDLMRLMSHMLKAAGFEVVQAYGGEDALRKVQTRAPDLILTDLAMPKMSGVEVIHRLKSNPDLQHIPVVAVTAYIWDTIAQAAGGVGVDGFIAKPVTATRLLQEVAKYIPVPGPRAAASPAVTRPK